MSAVDGSSLEETGELEPHFRVFVGRDSFGVALNAKVSGTVEDQVGDCWKLAGTGQVTHLGKTTVTEHTACIDKTASPNRLKGTFTYEGQTGGVIEGSYEGRLENGGIEADVTIEQVEDIQAVKEEPEETPPGGGTMTGRLTETEFYYTIEGRLFQRTRKSAVKTSHP